MAHLPGVHRHGVGWRAYRTPQEASAAREELQERLSRVRLRRGREILTLEDPARTSAVVPQ
jgi:hypothetical protein